MHRSTRLLAVMMALGLGLVFVPPATGSEPGSTPAVHRGANEWLLRDDLSPGSASTSFRYGRADDWPLMCDWDGDGVRTPGVVRERADGRWVWHLRNALGGGPADDTFVYGRWDMNDEPICGDWNAHTNNDRIQSAGVVRFPDSVGRLRWLLRDVNAGGPADTQFSYGRITNPGDLPWIVVGDWNGTGPDTPGLVWKRDRLLWQLRMENRAGPADVEVRYGLGELSPSLDVPIVGDWDGNGVDTIGVARGISGPMRWLLKNSLTPGAADVSFAYGRGDDWPMVWKAESFVPPNDDIADATRFNVPFNQRLDTRWATTAPDDPDCFGNAASVWYAFTASVDMELRIEADSSDFVPTLSVYTGSPGELNQLACVDTRQLVAPVMEGETVYVMLGARSPGNAGGEVDFVAIEYPPHRDVTTARTITTLPYSDRVEEWSSPPLWYQFTAPEDMRITVTTREFERFNVWTGTPGNLSRLNCEVTGDEPLIASCDVQADETYYIDVAGYESVNLFVTRDEQ